VIICEKNVATYHQRSTSKTLSHPRAGFASAESRITSGCRIERGNNFDDQCRCLHATLPSLTPSRSAITRVSTD